MGWSARLVIMVGIGFAGVGLLGAAEAPAPDSAEFLPLEEVRPGQRGIGLSVFQGTRPDTFEVEILGILENIGPGRNLILGRARSELLDRTGIVAGMSGSPVYVDGRLVGATAYAWQFATEPIVGITPIEEMFGLVERSEGSEMLGLGPGPEEGLRLALGPAEEPVLASDIRPIQTPVVLAGLAGPARGVWQSFFAPLGFVGVEGGGRAPEDAGFDPVPGAAIGIQLVRGDATMTAIGTVTWVEDGKLLGFGHPFLMAGPVSLPMSSVYIHTVLPSQMTSFKVASPGGPVGAVLEDRQAGVLAVIGRDAPMLPVSVTVASAGGKDARAYHYEITRSEILIPDLVGLLGYSSLIASEKAVGESTLDIRTRVKMRSGKVLSSEVAVASTIPPSAVTEQIGWPVRSLVENPFEKAEIEEIHVGVEIVDRLEAAAIGGLRVDRARVHPGDEVDVWVTLRPYREPVVVEHATVRIPPEARPGELEILACASGDLWDRESERAPLRFEPTDFDQLLDLLGSRRSTRKVYVQLFERRGGRVLEGRELPRLPGSVLSVLDSGARAGRMGQSAGAVLSEIEIETDWVVTGCRGVRIRVVSR